MLLKRSLIACFFCAMASPVFAQQVKSIKMDELAKIMSESTEPMVINFWATYCKPCIAEMPSFEKLAAKYKKKGLRLLFVSLDMQDDYPAKVDSFVAKRNMQHEVVWLNETDADYFCPKVDPKWSGAIPATLLIDTKKGYHRFFEEELPEAKLEKEIMTMLR